MPQSYDATAKALIAADPASYLALAGVHVAPGTPLDVISPDLAAVSAQADVALRVGGPRPWVVHVEFQGRSDRRLPERLARYGLMLRYQTRLPVRSVAILMNRRADRPPVPAFYEDWLPDSPQWYVRYEYQVIRLFREPVERLLDGGLGVVPLAPLADVERRDLPAVVERIGRRFAEVGGVEGRELWTATRILMGMRYDAPWVERLLQGVREMEDSTTYQAIIRKGKAQGLIEGEEKGLVKGIERGRAQEARHILLAQGHKRFGPPDVMIVGALNAVEDPERLEALALRLLDVGSWEELFWSPPTRRRRRKGSNGSEA